jgi:hypothetical protein
MPAIPVVTADRSRGAPIPLAGAGPYSLCNDVLPG